MVSNNVNELTHLIYTDLYYKKESGLISLPIQLLTTNILSKLKDSFVVILTYFPDAWEITLVTFNFMN